MNPLFTFNRFLPTVLVFGTVGGILLVLASMISGTGQLVVMPYWAVMVLAFIVYRPETDKRFRTYFFMGLMTWMMMSILLLTYIAWFESPEVNRSSEATLLFFGLLTWRGVLTSLVLSGLATASSWKMRVGFQRFLPAGLFWGIAGGILAVATSRLSGTPGIGMLICLLAVIGFYLTLKPIGSEIFVSFFLGGCLTYVLSNVIYFLGVHFTSVHIGTFSGYAWILLLFIGIGAAINLVLSALVSRKMYGGGID